MRYQGQGRTCATPRVELVVVSPSSKDDSLDIASLCAQAAARRCAATTLLCHNTVPRTTDHGPAELRRGRAEGHTHTRFAQRGSQAARGRGWGAQQVSAAGAGYLNCVRISCAPPGNDGKTASEEEKKEELTSAAQRSAAAAARRGCRPPAMRAGLETLTVIAQLTHAKPDTPGIDSCSVLSA
jgi:hypothetical protein